MTRPEESSTGDAAERFLRGIVNTHDSDQMASGMDDMAQIIFDYYKSLQEKGFHRSKAFILVRDWHGMFWNLRFNHELIHMHPEVGDDDEEHKH